MKPTTDPNPIIVEEAAHWAVRLDDDDLQGAEKSELAAWLRQSPQHVQELLAATAVLASCAALDPERSISIDELLSEKAPEVIPLMARRRDQAPPLRGLLRTLADNRVAAAIPLILVLALGALVVAGVLDLGLWGKDARVYATAVGEQRSVALDDGSVVHLNTRSRVAVDFSGAARVASLLDGEAVFKVARDAQRPFKVHAGDTLVEVRGTEFNVRLYHRAATITVLEGRVAVSTTGLSRAVGPEGGSPEAVIVAAGNQAVVSGDGRITAHTEADLEKALSWRTRRLIFRSDPLGTVVDEFNRYNRMEIVVADDALALTSISGVFSADDPDSLLQFLATSGKAQVTRVGRDRAIVQAATER